MQSILEIYSKYKIMPNLQEHQLRVTAVAKQICDSISMTLNIEDVVSICLVHDMGNIIKFNLIYFPDFLQPEGLEYWQKVKDEFIEKYGKDEHLATEKICEEIGLSKKQMEYLKYIGFTKVEEVLSIGSLEQKICCYADQRVGPLGVISIDERLQEGSKRYEGVTSKMILSEKFDDLVYSLKELERQIFTQSSLKPEDINDKSIKPILLKLKSYNM